MRKVPGNKITGESFRIVTIGEDFDVRVHLDKENEEFTRRVDTCQSQKIQAARTGAETKPKDDSRMVERLQLISAIDSINATAYENDPEGLILADRLAERGHLIARLYHAAITILRSRMDQLGGETETHVEVIRDALIYIKEHGTI